MEIQTPWPESWITGNKTRWLIVGIFHLLNDVWLMYLLRKYTCDFFVEGLEEGQPKLVFHSQWLTSSWIKLVKEWLTLRDAECWVSSNPESHLEIYLSNFWSIVTASTQYQCQDTHSSSRKEVRTTVCLWLNSAEALPQLVLRAISPGQYDCPIVLIWEN